MTYDLALRPRDAAFAPLDGSAFDAETPAAAAQGETSTSVARSGQIPAATPATVASYQPPIVLHAPAASAPAPDATGDLSRLGAAFGSTRPAQMLWNAHSVALVIEAGRAQNGLDPAQAQRNAQLADKVFDALAANGAADAPLAPADLAMLLRASGLSYERVDPGQLIAAARYVNAGGDAQTRGTRLRETFDSFHILDRIGHPQLTAQQMKDLLWGAATVPGHAFGSMNDREIAARYQDVAAALNGQAGAHKVRIGKHELKFTLDANGQVLDASTKKPSIWGKIGRIALTVASFVPIPVIAIPARIASAALSAVEGIRNGNWLQAVSGAAGAVAAGAGAIAGTAVSGLAATTARVATQISRAATAVQSGLEASRGQSGVGLFAGIVQTTANAAGAFAQGAGRVAEVARDVQTWSNRTLIGTRVMVDLRNGQLGNAVVNGAALTANIAGDFVDRSGRIDPQAARVQQIAGYGADAGRIVTSMQRRDFDAVLTGAAGLTRRIDADHTDGPPSGNDSRVADYLDYAAAGLGIGRDVRQGLYSAALTRSADLLDDISDGIPGNRGQRAAGTPDMRAEWARRFSEWLDYTAAGIDITRNVQQRRYDTALSSGARLIDDVTDGVSGNRGQRASGTQDQRPDWARTVSQWLDYAAIAVGLGRSLRPQTRR